SPGKAGGGRSVGDGSEPARQAVGWAQRQQRKFTKELSMTTKAKAKKTAGKQLVDGVASKAEKIEMRLYVVGQTPNAIRRIANLKAICENHLKGRYIIDVVDLLEKPQLARGDQIVAIPSLVRKLPLPVRKIIGDLSDSERVLVGLNLE